MPQCQCARRFQTSPVRKRILGRAYSLKEEAQLTESQTSPIVFEHFFLLSAHCQ
jgi:hypothetical protein